MENHCNAAHDLHFLLKEAAVDAYTSISRWMGEREGSLFSEENVTDQETSFHSALIHIRDVLDNLQESDPDLFWNKGQRDECLRLLNPFCRETLKLSRKVQRLAEMLGQHVRELEPALIKFGSEHQFKERDPAPPRTSKLNFFNKGSLGDPGTDTVNGSKNAMASQHHRRRVRNSIWKFVTCRRSNKPKTNKGSKESRDRELVPLQHEEEPIDTTPPIVAETETAPGEAIPRIFMESEPEPQSSKIQESAIPEPRMIQWSDGRMEDWLENNTLDQPMNDEDGSLGKQALLMARIVSEADAKYLNGGKDESVNQNETNVQNANESPDSFLFPQDPFNFLKNTVKDLRAVVSRVTFNLRLMERNFYEPPHKVIRSKETSLKELRDFVGAVRGVGEAFGEDKKEYEREEIELFELLGEVYYQALDCVKNFDLLSEMVGGDGKFLKRVIENYRPGDPVDPSDEETFGHGTTRNTNNLDLIFQDVRY